MLPEPKLTDKQYNIYAVTNAAVKIAWTERVQAFVQFMVRAHKGKKMCDLVSFGGLLACLAPSKTIEIVHFCHDVVTKSIN